jgi:preprotein translocase subunit SecF
LLLATPLLVDIKMRDRRFQEQAARVLSRRRRAKSAAAQPDPPAEGVEPDLADDAELARQLRRERAVAAAASTPSRAGKPAHAAGRARPTGKASRPTGKRHR